MLGRPHTQAFFKNRGSHIGQRFLRLQARDRTPLTISHERIYILPSKRGWMFIFSLMIMLVASMNYAINLGFALCFLLTGMLSSSLLATYRNLAGLSVENVNTDTAFAGESLSFRLQLRNPDNRERAGIKVKTDGGQYDIIHISPRAKVTAELEIPAKRRGWRRLGRLTLSSDYPLGLWSGWSYFHTPCSGLIYPAPEKKPPPLPKSKFEPGQDNQAELASGNEEIIGLKAYQPGEPISRIAWKAVARGQGWFSKEFADECGSVNRCFAFADTANLNTMEARLSRLTSWILQAEGEGADYALQLPDFQSAYSRGGKHRNSLLKKLALFGMANES